MEPIQIHVSVELNLSQDVKNFLSSVVSNHVATPAPAATAAPAPKPAPAAPAAPAPKPAPAAPAAPAPKPAPAAPAAPAAPVYSSEAPQVTIEQVRQALAAKVNGHREEIKEKLNSLGAPSVTKLDPAKYSEMFVYLNSLS